VGNLNFVYQRLEIGGGRKIKNPGRGKFEGPITQEKKQALDTIQGVDEKKLNRNSLGRAEGCVFC